MFHFVPRQEMCEKYSYVASYR
uniref:Uncharacterized protein n=1 Tax=Anguilla anguilla TaxID=7936 RepID=A0A0E9U4U4_ANGAN